MGKCRRCINCVNCDIVRFYSFNIVKVFLLRTFLKALLWRAQHIAYMRELYKSVTGWLAFYPERRRAVLYIMGYKIILWISVDEAGTHAVT